MRRFILVFCLALTPALAHAWNAAGHRLTALIAWQQLAPRSQQLIGEILAHHPDFERWQSKSRSTDLHLVFAEASTWPDSIRNDPRFFDENRSPATPSIPGLPDTARHKNWHYVDIGEDGKKQIGELDLQIDRLSQLIRSSENNQDIAWALPWLLHLVADIHQPLHTGRHADSGGNAVEIENPFHKRQPFSNLHEYWDELPGPSSLRGKRLEQSAAHLTERYPAPLQASVNRWRDESRRLLAAAYPPETGSLLPIVTEAFRQQSQEIANQRIVDAGYRLGHLLQTLFAQRVSRGTRKTSP